MYTTDQHLFVPKGRKLLGREPKNMLGGGLESTPKMAVSATVSVQWHDWLVPLEAESAEASRQTHWSTPERHRRY